MTLVPGDKPTSRGLLAIIDLANRLGVDTNLDQLRRRFSLEPGEPSTGTLISLALELGLEARALHVTFSDLPGLARTLPAILRSKDGGALLLENAKSDPMSGSVAVIRDPSAPLLRRRRREPPAAA